MTKYNDGVANTTDFYTSSDYTKILDQTQLLSDRDNLFVIGVQDQIDRIPDLINLANDNLTYYNDLLSSYQSDTSISSSKLDRIQAWLNRAIDQVNSRIDSLNTQQSTLQTNLPTYQSFQTDVTTFLSDITTAGGGTSSGSTTGTSTNLVEALQSLPTSSVVMSRVTASCSTSMPVSSAAVPEPSAIMIVLMALGTVAAGRSCRPRRS
jgi:PEP-CTERM motif